MWHSMQKQRIYIKNKKKGGAGFSKQFILKEGDVRKLSYKFWFGHLRGFIYENSKNAFCT